MPVKGDHKEENGIKYIYSGEKWLTIIEWNALQKKEMNKGFGKARRKQRRQDILRGTGLTRKYEKL